MKKQFDIKKLVLLNMPYILMGLFATNFGEAWRMAQGADASEKFLSLVAVLPGALQSFWPSLHPLDLLVGLCCGAGLRLAVYLKSKNAKKYRHGLEYGSARWGTREDIAPYVDPVFQNNVILTKTESLTMNSRPKDPKTARNKNVLVIGGSGSGKTRFWLKPNLMQMHSSYVVTDPKDEPKPTPAKKPAPQPTKPIISYDGFTPKTNTAQSTQASGSKIHKPSNSYTPRSASGTPGSFTPRPSGSSVGIGVAKPSFGLNSQPVAQPKPPVKVDVSKIKVGVKVKHKAFGIGTVAAIQPDMVTVRFGGVEKKFLLPAAIVQGYLSLMEN